MNAYEIIDTILMTEKSMEFKDHDKYIFVVSKFSTKINIKRAIEDIYDVKVKSVNVLNRKGKPKRMGRKAMKQGYTASTRRAVVTLSKGSIEVL